LNENVGRWAELMEGAQAFRGGSPARRIAQDPTLVDMLSLRDWWRFAAETIGLTAVIVALDIAFIQESAVAAGMPNPYWVPVLLMACQYGVLGGLFATIISSAAYLALDSSSQSAALDFYAYAATVAGQPAAWLATALILGGLRSLHIRHARDLADQIEESTAAAEELSGALESALAEIQGLERSIAVNAGSAATVLRSLARLDTTHPRAAAISFADLIRHGVGASRFAIYLRDASGFRAAHLVDGERALAVSELPPLEGALARAVLTTGEAVQSVLTWPVTGERVPVVAISVRRASDSEAMAAVVCQTSGLSEDVAVVRWRLDHLARALAALMSACGEAPPKGTSDDRG
jgi:hypothetical protein